jgi:hypothetical protein
MIIKNPKLNLYDRAFQNESSRRFNQTLDQNRDVYKSFVMDVREAFFQHLIPYVKSLPKLIDTSDDMAAFDQYFDKETYLESFMQTEMQDFATQLVDTAQFIHFCDEIFLNELTNFKMC